jgi:hypothetical protein
VGGLELAVQQSRCASSSGGFAREEREDTAVSERENEVACSMGGGPGFAAGKADRREERSDDSDPKRSNATKHLSSVGERNGRAGPKQYCRARKT